MAKKYNLQKNSKTVNKTFFNSFNFDNVIPIKYQLIAALGLIIVLFLIFFSPVFFQGQSFQSGDIVAGHSSKAILEHNNGTILWNPYVFCGLPSQFSGLGYSRWFDFINTGYGYIRTIFGNIFGNEYAQHIIFLIVLSYTSFFFMRNRKASILISLLVAIAASFSTGIIVFVFLGHITKLYALAVFPLILMIILKFQEKINLLDYVILVVGMTLLINGWHVQIIFYIFFSILIYYIFFMIKFLIKKETENFKKLVLSGLLVISSIIIALGISSDIYAQLYEYTKYSTRGTKSVVESTSEENGIKSEADFYKYATDWSFSPQEVLTFIVPSYYGFGNLTYKGPLSNEEEVDVNGYFGQMPFVDVAMYMGVIIFVLGLYAMYGCRKNPFVQYLTVLFFITLFISFGRNFPILFDLMFHYFPAFNKFRVPSMILVIPQIIMPILAGYGILRILELKKDNGNKEIKILKIVAISSSICLFFALILTSSISNWIVDRISLSEHAQQLQQISDFIGDVFVKDLLLSLLFISITFWSITLFLKDRLSKDLMIVIILFLVVIDLFRVSGRGAKYVQQQDLATVFSEPSYISAIKNIKNDQPFRILNLKQDGSLGSINQNSNFHEYFMVQDLYGYSGIKPRSFQDFVDVVNVANPTLWRMLNVKYIILDRNYNFPGLSLIDSTNHNFLYQNNNALPRAFFVDSVSSKNSIDLLNSVKNNSFDPKHISFVDENLIVDKPDSTSYVKIDKYDNDIIEISVKASGKNFLFLSDTYYPIGWKAYIDGFPTKIYKVNHGFRGLIVPKGMHEVKFEYAPVSYYYGKMVSLSLNILVIIGLVTGLFLKYKKKKNNLDIEDK